MNDMPRFADDVRQSCTAEEWEARCELAAIYHLLVKYRMTDLTNQWHSHRVPGEDALLSHHYGLFHEEVTASRLIKVGFDGTNHNPGNGTVNPSATAVSQAFFEARPELNCVMHIHTKAIMGVSAQVDGLQPYSQAFLMIGGHEQIGYTRFEYDCTDTYLAELLAAAEGRGMIVDTFHGAFVLGRTAAEGFFRAFYLDQACNVQLTVQQATGDGGAITKMTDDEMARHLQSMRASPDYGYDGSLEWAACRRALDREMPAYKT